MVERGQQVRYHGSLVAEHGIWTMLGDCPCCGGVDLYDPATGRTLEHVRDQSWTPLVSAEVQ